MISTVVKPYKERAVNVFCPSRKHPVPSDAAAGMTSQLIGTESSDVKLNSVMESNSSVSYQLSYLIDSTSGIPVDWLQSKMGSLCTL